MSKRSTIANLPDLDEIYKNILTSFDPAAKRLVHAGRELLRAWIGVADATKVYVDALEKLGLAGSNCGGETKEIGQCLLQIAETMKELNKNEKNTIGFYEAQILVPTEANLEQDSKVILDQRKMYEKKLKQMVDRVKRDKKKGVPTSESELMLFDYQSDCVKQALTEEKKRYTYMLDRHCALTTRHLHYHRMAVELYERGIQKWKEACANPEELSDAALAALDAAIQPYATQSSLTLSTVSRLDGRSLSNTENETVSNSSPLPAKPIMREQGVGSFNINEGETVKTTLDSTIAQVNQRQQQPLNGSTKVIPDIKHSHEVRRVDYVPPTENSTLSSSGAKANDPVSTAHKHSTFVSKDPGAPSTNGVYNSQNGSLPKTNEDAEYAIALKHRRPVTMIKEDAISANTSVLNAERGSPVRRHAVALFSYTNSGSNQLSFQEGDTILIIQDGQQGWQFGENLMTGKRGWYPASFIKPTDVNPRTYQGLSEQAKSRSNSSSFSTKSANAADYSGPTTYNGNGLKYSYINANGGPDGNEGYVKSNGRAMSMIVLQPVDEEPMAAFRRPAPPPPPRTSYLSMDATNSPDSIVQNPFSHVRLRQIIKTDGTPKKYG